jgi:hypothetical protein
VKQIPGEVWEQHVAILPNAMLPPIRIAMRGHKQIALFAATESDKAYAAGLFDGEGNVHIALDKRRASAAGDIFNMRIGVSQNDITPLLWLQQRWGGSIVAHKRRTSAHNVTHGWGCFAKMAAVFLADTLPYLQVKRERAELALKFQTRVFQPGQTGHSPEFRAESRVLRDAIAALNGHKPVRTP